MLSFFENFISKLFLFILKTYSQCAHVPSPTSENTVCQEFFKWAASKDGKKEKVNTPDKMAPGNIIGF